MVGRPGVTFPVVLKGNKFCTVDDSGDTTHVTEFNPVNCALKGLTLLAAVPTAAPVGFRVLQVSTRLLPAPVDTLAGTVIAALP